MENITFKQFLITYSFRYITNNKDIREDTDIIRIYPPNEDLLNWNHRWFEFGIYDFSEDSWKWSIVEQSLSKEILESYVSSFWADTETSTLHVQLTKNRERDYY